MYSKSSIWQEIKYKYHYGGAHVKLIFINVGIFIFLSLFIFFDKLIFKGIGGEFVMDNILGSSGLRHNLIKPWTIITNLFVHDINGLSHIFFNMLVLYVFGNIVKDLIGNSKILPVFLYSGLFGYLFFVLIYNLIPEYRMLGPISICGASGGIMGITFAAVAISPNYEIRLLFLGNVKIKWIALFYVFINIITLQGSNAGGSLSHLAGGLMGFIFIQQLQRGRDLAKPFYWLEDWVEYLKKPKPKAKVVYKKEEKVPAGNREYRAKTNAPTESNISKQERLDDILDKISRSGYDSLSTEEKSFLFKISQED
jgi:membrane associated rhomboid family serine protease